jgi:succinyl-diaminopimelate desuccinylase
MQLEVALKKLISFKTVTGNHAEVAEAFQWIKDQLQPVPVYMHEHEKNGFQSLVITTSRTKTPKLWLAAHIDVVDGSPDVFVPRESQGRLYGRGAFDMKFAIACYLKLLRELDMSAREYDFGIMLTSDEEQGGFFGTGHLVNDLDYRGEIVFLPDGGGPWQFEENAKGKWEVQVFAEGQSAHGSRPWHGKNAILMLATFLQEVESAITAAYPATEDHWQPSVNVGVMRGGAAVNQVPHNAEASLDIRYTSNEEQVAIARILEEIADRHAGVRWSSVYIEPAHEISRSNGECCAFIDMARDMYGIEMGWTRSHGSSDARFFAKHGIPVLLTYPNAAGSHSEQEWVDLHDVERFYCVLAAWVKKVARA